MMNAEVESAIRRAQKMLAIAADDRANPQEAATAAAMAEKLMRKFSLDHEDVMRAEFARADNFTTADASVVMKKGQGHRPRRVPPWAQWLAARVAALNDCAASLATNPELGACIRFYGYSADVAVAAFSYDFITTAAIRAIRVFQAGGTRSKAESESYRRGFILSVIRAISEAIAAKEAEMAAATSSGRALMVVKAAAIQEHFGIFRTRKAASAITISNADAFYQGREDGNRLDVLRRAVAAGTTAAHPALER